MDTVSDKQVYDSILNRSLDKQMFNAGDSVWVYLYKTESSREYWEEGTVETASYCIGGKRSFYNYTIKLVNKTDRGHVTVGRSNNCLYTEAEADAVKRVGEPKSYTLMSILQRWIEGKELSSPLTINPPKIGLTNKQVDSTAKVLRNSGYKISNSKLREISDAVFSGTYTGSDPVAKILYKTVKGMGIDIPEIRKEDVEFYTEQKDECQY